MESVTNYFKIESNPKLKMSPDGDFFRAWVEFLKPFHKLAKREMDILAVFLKKRYELSKVILDTDLLDKVLMSKGTKLEIRKTCGISAKHFQVIMCKFRKNGVVQRDNVTNIDKFFLNLIPSITDDGVGLLVYFDFKNEQSSKAGSLKDIQKAKC